MRRNVTLVLVAAVLCAAVLPMVAAAQEKPRIAVLEFKNKANWGWWSGRGAAAAQDVFVTELVKSGEFRVIEREQLQALLREKNLSLSGDIDPSTAVRAGKLLGVDYFLTGALTEAGSTRAGGGGWRASVGVNKFEAAMNARLIDTETGEIVWADEARGDESNVKVRVRGYGGGVDRDERMFDKVLKPIIGELVTSLKGADV